MVWGSFSLYRSPTRLYLQSVDVKEDFLSLRRSPAALACAARLYRLTAAEAPAECENDGLLRTLWSAMVQLRDGAMPAAVEFRYMWRLLAAMGTAPSLEYCAGCGERLARGGLFTDEGILCGAAPRGRRALLFRSANCSCCAPRLLCPTLNSSNGPQNAQRKKFLRRI